eukprot:2513373-Alexandrium_andersonii.AAC.1
MSSTCCCCIWPPFCRARTAASSMAKFATSSASISLTLRILRDAASQTISFLQALCSRPWSSAR